MDGWINNSAKLQKLSLQKAYGSRNIVDNGFTNDENEKFQRPFN